MIYVDWFGILLGLCVGTVMGVLFFAGLAFGMRFAMRTQCPIRLLALSAGLRITGLLVTGWFIVVQGGLWTALGYGVAFFGARIIVTTLARVEGRVEVSVGDAL